MFETHSPDTRPGTLTVLAPRPGDRIISRRRLPDSTWLFTVERTSPYGLGTLVKGGGTGSYRWVKTSEDKWLRLGTDDGFVTESQILENLELYGATVEHQVAP